MLPTGKFLIEIDSIPSFPEEPHDGGPLRPDLRVQTTSRWTAQIGFFGGYFSWTNALDLYRGHLWGMGYVSERKFRPPGPFLKTLERDTADLATLRQTFDWVVQNLAWHRTLAPVPFEVPKLLFRERLANSAERNLYFASLAKHLGFSVDLLLVRAQQRGYAVEQLPSLYQFDSVLPRVRLDGKTYVFDLATVHPAFATVPAGRYAPRVLPVGDDSDPVFEALEVAPLPSTVLLRAHWEDEALHVAQTANYGGQSAHRRRHQLLNDRTATRTDYFDRFLRPHFPEAVVDSVSYRDLKASTGTFRETLTFVAETGVEQIGDRLLVQPVLLDRYDENPFPASTRQLPLLFDEPLRRKYIFSFTVPEGYRVVSLPVSGLYVGPAHELEYRTSEKNGAVTVVVRFERSESQFHPDHYSDLQKFYNQVVEKHGELIVLERMKDD